MTLERPLVTRCRHTLVALLRPRGKLAFLKSLPPGACVLDVGCGNNRRSAGKLDFQPCPAHKVPSFHHAWHNKSAMSNALI